MILTTFSEEQLLAELVIDYKRIKRLTKRTADAYLLKAKKNGRFIRDTEYQSYTIKTVLNNKWNVEIEYDQRKNIPWLFRACCIIESDKKTKDYYIVRGVNSDKPYYVKVTSHALKRVRERNNFKRLNIGIETLACWTFEHRETAICMKYLDAKFHQVLMNMEDADDIDDVSYVVLTNRGIYYATKTPCGNYIFKTYISSLMGLTELLNFRKNKKTKWSQEGELLEYMVIAHQYYNKEQYDEDILDEFLYSVFDRDQEIELTKNSPIILLKN